ncbi:hypothetical protein MNBD_CHLOROFLEXI01-3532, partial [hydrothermal vent metagenome]
APETIKFCARSARCARCARCATPMKTQRVGDKLRRACPACGFIHFTDPKVGVGVFVLHEGKILLVRRTMHPQIGKWSIPAGFVDAGEDPRETAVREALGGFRKITEGNYAIFRNPLEAFSD